MPLDPTAARNLLDHANGVAVFTVVAPLRLTLRDNGGSARGVPQVITLSAAVAGTGGKQTTSNAAAVVFTNMPDCTITQWEIYDSSATPQRIWYGATTRNRVVPIGDSYEVPAGALVLELG